MQTINIQAKDFKTGDKVTSASGKTLTIINPAGGIIGHGLYFDTDKGEWAFNAAKKFQVQRPGTAEFSQHNATCSCGLHHSLMTGQVGITCKCGATYDRPELGYNETQTVTSK